MTFSIKATLILAALLPSLSGPQARDEAGFSSYPARIYRGPIRLGNLKQIDGKWRDGSGKQIEPPHINFAGKYFVALHSCGASCRYYSMTDLSSGIPLNALDMFASAEPPPRTKAGYVYTTLLESRAESRLLIARYRIAAPNGELCSARKFILENETLAPVTRTVPYSCDASQ